MPTAKDSKTADLPPGEAVLLEVVRSILRGDGDEVAPRIRKLVTTTAGRRSAKLSEAGRAAIALMFAEEAAAAPPTSASGLRRVVSYGVNGASATHEDASLLELHDQPVATPILDTYVSRAIDNVVSEYRQSDKLLAAGLHPTRTILLSGPPGVGKSMTIKYLASRLGRPLIRVEAAEVIGSLLGESARLLTAAFAEARAIGAVLALDEIDALAKRRDDINDVGEFKRLVSTLLVELDRWGADTPLIAATNHLDLLDPALERRFEMHVRMGPPLAEGRKAILGEVLTELDQKPNPGTIDAVVEITDGASGSLLSSIAHRAARRAVIDGEPLDRALLRAALPPNPSDLQRSERVRFATAATELAGLSSRQVGEALGCSHTAAQRLARSK